MFVIVDKLIYYVHLAVTFYASNLIYFVWHQSFVTCRHQAENQMKFLQGLRDAVHSTQKYGTQNHI
jgi:hypothetical protein